MKKYYLILLPIISVLSLGLFGCNSIIIAPKKEEYPSTDIVYKLRRGNHDQVVEKDYIFSNEKTFSISLGEFVDKSNYKYDQHLAMFNALLCDDLNGQGEDGGVYIKIDDQFVYNYPGQNILHYLDFQDISYVDLNNIDYPSDPFDVSRFNLAHIDFNYNKKNYTLFSFSFYGTGSNKELASNFDIGIDSPIYITKTNPRQEWVNKNNHKGFDISANRAYSYIENYIETFKKDDSEIIIDLVGHSRGASIANIIGTYFEDRTNYKTFTYTFAAPATTSNINKTYNTIYNFVNTDDVMPYLPNSNQDFYRYGTDIKDSALNYKKEFDEYFNNEYVYEAPTIEPIKELLDKLIPSRTGLYTPQFNGVISSLTKIAADIKYDEEIEFNRKVDEKYSHCIDIENVKYNNETKRYEINYHYSSSILINIMLSAIAGETIDIAIPLASYCGELIEMVLPYVEPVLSGGITSFLKAHMLGGYEFIVMHNN